MATLRYKRKLAAVSIDTPGYNRKNSSKNELEPEMAQDYISEDSEEIYGPLTKELSKEFSRTESVSYLNCSVKT